MIQSAAVQDRDGAVSVIDKLMENWRKVIKIFADGAYGGKLIDKVKDKFKIALVIIKRDQMHAFKILPKRWIVERTFPGLTPIEETQKITNALIKRALPWYIFPPYELCSNVFKQFLSYSLEQILWSGTSH